jgi:purine-binding chemotaxis protein CheW
MNPHRYRHDPSKNLVGFVIANVSYAVPIAAVREISNPLLVVELPHAPSSVIGVADYRGAVIPVIDMRARFGLPALEVTRRTKWIVVNVENRLAALLVDGVSEVFGASGTELTPAPPLGGGDDLRSIVGVTNHGGRMIFVLDLTCLKDVMAPAAVATTHRTSVPLLQKGSGSL